MKTPLWNKTNHNLTQTVLLHQLTIPTRVIANMTDFPVIQTKAPWKRETVPHPAKKKRSPNPHKPSEAQDLRYRLVNLLPKGDYLLDITMDG